ncbi:MAG: helix-turn-helix transcriptional regulator [Synergistaceae bacterium]|nr:helix-turn-helix transcriptional regulator [Synergistaceae bacterium]
MIPAVPFAQTVYGSWLLQTGCSPATAEFLAQGLAMAAALNYLTAAIYLRLYEAVELLRAQRLGHAASSLKETLALALPDRLYLPFAEGYEEIEPILEECCATSEATAIRGLAERLAAGRKDILCGHRFTLSEAELLVAKCAARGMHNAEIAEELNLSPNTIKKHLKSIFKKLGIEDRRDIPTL